MLIFLFITFSLCVVSGGPDLEKKPEKIDTNCKITVIKNTIGNHSNGLNIPIKIFLREKLLEEDGSSQREDVFERIKTLETTNYMLCENLPESNSDDDEIQERGSDEDFESTDDITSSMDTELERIKSGICRSLIKNMTKSIRRNLYLDFAIEARYSDKSRYFLIMFKNKHIEVTLRRIVDGKPFDDYTWKIFDFIDELDIFTADNSYKDKIKNILSLVIDRLIALGLLTKDNSEHFTLVVSRREKEKKTLLRDLLMFPFSIYLKRLFEKVLMQKNVPVDSVTFVNNGYFKIVEAILKKYNSDFSTFTDDTSEENSNRYSDLITVDVLKSSDYRITPVEKPPNTLETHQSLADNQNENEFNETSNKVEVILDTQNDHFTMFFVFLNKEKGKIFNVHINKAKYQKLIKHKIRELIGNTNFNKIIESICENINLISDYTILSLANSLKTVTNKEDQNIDFLYTLLFSNKDWYQKAIKQVLLTEGLHDKFFNLIKEDISIDSLELIKKELKITEEISTIDIFLCDKLREIHFKGFSNVETLKSLQKMVLNCSIFRKIIEATEVKESLMKAFTLENLLIVRKFTINEILSVVSELLAGNDIGYNFQSKFEESFKDESNTVTPWTLDEEFSELREKLKRIYDHQEIINDGLRPAFFLH